MIYDLQENTESPMNGSQKTVSVPRYSPALQGNSNLFNEYSDMQIQSLRPLADTEIRDRRRKKRICKTYVSITKKTISIL